MAGNTALATPAASAVASAPPTRTVFFVAEEGKPSLAAASLSSDFVPSWGGRSESPPRLQPESPAAAVEGQGRIGTCAHAAHCNWTRGPATSVSRLTGWSTRIVD